MFFKRDAHTTAFKFIKYIKLMGLIVNQGIKNSLSFYLGMAIGAINTILIYPNVFNNQPEHWGAFNNYSSIRGFIYFFHIRYSSNFYSFFSIC